MIVVVFVFVVSCMCFVWCRLFVVAFDVCD